MNLHAHALYACTLASCFHRSEVVVCISFWSENLVQGLHHFSSNFVLQFIITFCLQLQSLQLYTNSVSISFCAWGEGLCFPTKSKVVGSSSSMKFDFGNLAVSYSNANKKCYLVFIRDEWQYRLNIFKWMNSCWYDWVLENGYMKTE